MLAEHGPAPVTISHERWGNTRDGETVDLYTLTNGTLTARITTFGAHLVSLQAPGRDGTPADVVLGYPELSGYLADRNTYVGAVVGRYGNRIAGGTFQLDGQTYHVPVNDGENALHGGPVGFDRKVWAAAVLPDGLELTLVSPDGDMGFPGTLTAHLRYRLRGNSLHFAVRATTDKPTVASIVNHAYFNLAGEGSGDVLAQRLQIPADRFVPVRAGNIPTGELRPVAGTPFDFRKSTAIGEHLHAQDEQLRLGHGYDVTFVLRHDDGSGLREAARVLDPASGRTLTVHTTEPGVHVYSGNHLQGEFTGLGGVPYRQYAGFALETQHFPDSPNQPSFPSTELRPGETLRSETVFTFGVE